jgi:putative transposase
MKPWWTQRNHQKAIDIQEQLWTRSETTRLDHDSYYRLAMNSWFNVAATNSNGVSDIWPTVSRCLYEIDLEVVNQKLKSDADKEKREKAREEYWKSEKGLLKLKGLEDKKAQKEVIKEQNRQKRAERSTTKGKKRKTTDTPKKSTEPKLKKPKKSKFVDKFRTKLIRICFDKNNPIHQAQKSLILKWMGSARWTYNKCVEERNSCLERVKQIKEINPDYKSSSKDFEPCEKSFLSYKYVTSTSEVFDDEKNKVHLATPNDLRDVAVQEFSSAYATNQKRLFEQWKKGNFKYSFSMRFRTKKDDSESITIRSRVYKDDIFYPSFWKTADGIKLPPLPTKTPLPDKIEHDFKLIRKGNSFFIGLPLPMEIKQGVPQVSLKYNFVDNQSKVEKPLRETVICPPPEQKIVSIDPGIRTFATLYDPSGIHIDWAPNDCNYIRHICEDMDDLQSRIYQKVEGKDKFSLPSKKRYRMKKALTRMRVRVKNLVREVHNKLCKYLCENYNVVLIPKFESSKMVSRARRRINSRTVRSLLTWSHYAFRMRLHQKAEEHPWVKVIEVTEEYTSKTCGRCGTINKNLGGNKTFHCSNCNWIIDRDVNGARNILLKWMLSFM